LGLERVYLFALEVLVTATLLRKRNKKQILFHFFSYILIEPKFNYSNIENLVLVLVTGVRKLRTYFEACPIKVLIDQPWKKMLQKYDSLGRMLVLAVELSSFDREYSSKITIKAQALFGFLAKYIFKDKGIEQEID